MSINLTDELLAKTKKGKIASAKQVFLEGDQENLQQIGEKSHQLEDAIKDITVSGGASTANAVSYNNETSGMTAITAQGAIDELAAKNQEQEAAIGTKAEKSEVATELDKKFGKENIAQEFGDSKDKVVSQFALPFREIESPEFFAAWIDSEDHLLLGIGRDGSIEWGKGIPAPIQKKLHEIIKQSQQDKTDLTDALDAAKDELSAIITNLQETKVDKEDGKSLIDDEVKEHFSVIENEEWLCAMVDEGGKILFGIYRETGKPYYPLNEMYHVEQNKEFFAAWIDSEDHLLLGIGRDGQIYGEIHAVNALRKVVAKMQENIASLQEKEESISDIISIFSLQESTEFLAAETDADGKVLSATYTDGSHYSHNLKSETIPTEFSHMKDPENRSEITTDVDGRILSYRDKKGIKHERSLQVEHFYSKGKEITIVDKEYVDDYVNKINEEIDKNSIDINDIELAKLDGVIDNSLENLFDQTKVRSYDSDFADKVFAAIGRKTGETGCYSNNIPCKTGDWLTRNDFGTGIVVALDKDENILGDIKNVAYQPTFQVKEAEGQDFSKIAYVVLVVMSANVSTQKIVKAKYMPTITEDSITLPKLKIDQENMRLGLTTYVRGTSGRYYSMRVNDSETPTLELEKLDGIPQSELPSAFPTFDVSGDFSDYFDSIVFGTFRGGKYYIVEVNKHNLVSRFIQAKSYCTKTLVEDGVRYFYSVDGSMNSASGKLNIYKADGETFALVKGDITDTEGNLLEPHDSLVLSVKHSHYITQSYVEDCKTTVNGVEHTVMALHVEEQYEGKRVWIWKSEDYPELWLDSHSRSEGSDYLHNNTICIDKDGRLCLHNKHANQILVIQRTWDEESGTGSIGNIVWKIGGNKGTGNDYDVPTRIKTTEQEQWFEAHDAKVDNNGLYTMFDNQRYAPSRILEFNIDETAKSLKNFHAYTYKSYQGRYMGSVEKLKEGIYLICWGGTRTAGTPNIGVYDFNNNKAIFELALKNTSVDIYRVYGIKE